MKNYMHENIRLGSLNPARAKDSCATVNHHRRMRARHSEIIIFMYERTREIRGQVCAL